MSTARTVENPYGRGNGSDTSRLELLAADLPGPAAGGCGEADRAAQGRGPVGRTERPSSRLVADLVEHEDWRFEVGLVPQAEPAQRSAPHCRRSRWSPLVNREAPGSRRTWRGSRWACNAKVELVEGLVVRLCRKFQSVADPAFRTRIYSSSPRGRTSECGGPGRGGSAVVDT
jgi:hypothetical protein